MHIASIISKLSKQKFFLRLISNLKRLRAYAFQLRQKKFKNVTYVFEKKSGKTLLIVFSGFSANGKRARYNYVSSTRKLHASRLYILDNHGCREAGSYYLGDCDNWYLPEQICELVHTLKEKHGYEQIITMGSSKGGTAAVFYACMLHANAAIAGAPQYYIGKYLNKDPHLPILYGITQSNDAASIERLNQLVRNQLIMHQQDENKPKVYLHYSPQESTYQNHIADMLTDLRRFHFEVEEDCGSLYASHNEVGQYFIPYFQKICREILNSKRFF